MEFAAKDLMPFIFTAHENDAQLTSSDWSHRVLRIRRNR